MSDGRFKFGASPFYFARHGETNDSERGILQGQRNTELNKTGLISAEKCARALESVELGSIYASPLKRAWRTATIIKILLRIPIYSRPGLMERDWGIYQGRPKSCRPDEGDTDTVESLEDFTTRVLEAMASISGPCPVLVVAHSGVFRILCRRAGLKADFGLSISSSEPLRFDPPTDQTSTWRISMV